VTKTPVWAQAPWRMYPKRMWCLTVHCAGHHPDLLQKGCLYSMGCTICTLVFITNTFILTLGLLWGSSSLVNATEFQLRETPIQVSTTQYNKKACIAVHWGAVSGTLARSAKDIEESRKRLHDLLTSPQTLAYLQQQQEKLKDIEIKLGRDKGEAMAKAYRERVQDSKIPELALTGTVRRPMPAWVLYLPKRIFTGLKVGMFDARSSKQRAWALACRKKYPDVKLFVLGWDNMQSYDAWRTKDPEIGEVYTIATVNAEGKVYEAKIFADKYGVKSLPAFVTFPDRSTQIIEYGFNVKPTSVEQ
jgi:hypothetical protein